MAKYVGFKIGKVHESHVISEYYCGGCGFPVTDHDSFCPECGGAFRECDADDLESENAERTQAAYEALSDENWMVMPVEMYESYKELRIGDDYVRTHTRLARCLLYGIGRNGKPTFWEQPKSWVAEWHCRKYGAAELLFAMMWAMIANSGHSDVDHRVERY